MTVFPDNFILRPVTKDDAQAIAAGVAAEELAETGESETIVDEVQEFTSPGLSLFYTFFIVELGWV